MTKSLKEYALVAEVVGAVAVVISLIYVGVSVNQNTKAVMVSNHQAWVAMDQDIADWMKNPDFATTYVAASQDVSKLSPVQQSQLASYYGGRTNAWEFAFLSHKNGMMEDDIWSGWSRHYAAELNKTGGRWFWSLAKETYNPDFRMYVDSILAEIR